MKQALILNLILCMLPEKDRYLTNPEDKRSCAWSFYNLVQTFPEVLHSG